MKKLIIVSLLFIALTGCGSSIRQISFPQNSTMRNPGNIMVILKESSINDQTLLAKEDLKFRLATMGFSITNDRESADVIGELQIGTVRFDPLVGWIADCVFFNLTDVRTMKLINSFRVQGRFITPTVKNLISNLSKSIGDFYLY